MGAAGRRSRGAALSLLAVQWCRVNGWTDPDQHLAMCYSDFALLYGERGLADGLFPFVDDVPDGQVMEYPVLIAVVAGVMAAAVDLIMPGSGATDARTLAFYDLNHLAAVACWVGVVLITALSTARSRRRDALMVALAPGIILSCRSTGTCGRSSSAEPVCCSGEGAARLGWCAAGPRGSDEALPSVLPRSDPGARRPRRENP
ncbi:hypothetical protein [Nesterenkonia pannonica]|uniref:hypothetical protein n=1 Tax=Nesterenkonia pannonica TaxID=1548602 RepID=UPI0021641AE8|nr:hypothetical protein [Nesterenkonia pannonica]